MIRKRTQAITKILSRNDTGETGAHQAGILIIKSKEILSFFPALTTDQKNPRHNITFIDDSGSKWQFSFIYYNNKFFGGTRNEYRLTRMTPFINSHNLKSGDALTLALNSEGEYHISYVRDNEEYDGGDVLRLGTSWKVIQI